MDLALNNLQMLRCRKTQTTKQPIECIYKHCMQYNAYQAGLADHR